MKPLKGYVLAIMVIVLFCVPSFAIQGDVLPVDDGVFDLGIIPMVVPAATVDLAENTPNRIVASFANDSGVDLNLNVMGVDPHNMNLGGINPTRAVRDLSTVDTLEELFTITSFNNDKKYTGLNGTLRSEMLIFPLMYNNTPAANMLSINNGSNRLTN